MHVSSDNFAKFLLSLDLNNEEESKHLDNLLRVVLPGMKNKFTKTNNNLLIFSM